MLFGLFLLSLTFSEACSIMPHIQFGHNAPAGSYPWHLSLFLRKKLICGASLIAVPDMYGESDTAITAAHCMPAREHLSCGEDLQVVAGDHSLRDSIKLQGEIIENVSDFITHPRWTFCDSEDQLRGDIALIKLAKPLKFSGTIQPIDLPEANEEAPEWCSLSGYGMLERVEIQDDQEDLNAYKVITRLPKRLQELNLLLKNGGECRKFDDGTVPDWLLCAQLNPSSGTALHGDSGSGLACNQTESNFRLYGVVSHGASDAAEDSYTKVAYFLDWIKKAVKDTHPDEF